MRSLLFLRRDFLRGISCLALIPVLGSVPLVRRNRWMLRSEDLEGR